MQPLERIINTIPLSRECGRLLRIVMVSVVAAIQLVVSIGVDAETAAPQTKSPKVVILSNQRCCPKNALPEAENALLYELNTIVQRIQLVHGSQIPSENLQNYLADVAAQNDATVVIHLFRESSDRNRADIVTVYSGTTAHLQRLYFQTEHHSDGLQTAVLRIVESVRARLLKNTSHKKESPRKTTTEPPPKKNEPRYQLGVGAGFAAAWSPGGVHPSIGTGANVLLHLPSVFILELNGTWDFYTKDITHDEGKATFDIAVLRGTLYWELMPNGRFHPALGLSAGAVLVKSAGRSNPEIIANYNDKGTLATVVVAGRVAFDFNPYSSFVFNMKCGFLVPELKIHLNDEIAATYGRPMIEMLAGFEFMLF